MALLSDAWRRFRDSVIGSGQRDFLKEAADMDSGRLRVYDTADDYYDGNHRVRLTTREKEYLQASGVQFAENYCETIVDTYAAALRVRGFNSDSKEMLAFAKDLWRENRMDAGQARIHRGTARLGDYFAILEAEEGRLPCVYPNDPRHVKAVYDSGEMLYAVKVWNTRRTSAINPDGRGIRRMNVYWPDSIDKWFCQSQDGDVWAPFRQREVDEGNTDFWTMNGEPDGEPIGIPVVHFANKPDPHYGRPEHYGSIPQQDALNKSLVDLFWVMDAQGWPQQWGTGVRADQIERHPGSLFTTEKETAKFGQLAAADPEKSILAIESQIKRMASRSHTPLHEMLAGGNLPSGESLRTSESGFIRKGEDFQTENGNRHEDVVHLAGRIERAFGDRDVPEDASLDCKWKDVETRNEVDQANVSVLKKTFGVSNATILSEWGYDPEEEAAKREAEAPEMADELLKRAREMRNGDQAPTRSEETGGGRQPAQNPAARRV